MSLAALTLALTPHADDRFPVVESRLEQVVVYPDNARVRRVAELPSGGGVIAVRGLPPRLDVKDLDLVLAGGEVIRGEIRERRSGSVVAPGEVEALRARRAELHGERAALLSEREALELLAAHLGRLLKESEAVRRREDEPRSQAEVWQENLEFLTARIEDNRAARLAAARRVEELSQEAQSIESELARAAEEGPVVSELLVDVLALERGPLRLEIEYGVAKAGWQPSYDLRLAEDLSTAHLVYRAKVWQTSAEDWSDAAVVLSTSRPARALRVPEPAAQGLALHGPEATVAGSLADTPAPAPAGTKSKAVAAKPADAPGAGFASVEVEGGSVRFALPRRETIPSRPAPTNVLVGRADLDARPRHTCVPQRDSSAWLSAHLTNTSDWVLLPAAAGVYLGREFLGSQHVGLVAQGGELALELGADPGVLVERVLDRSVRRASFMGNRDAVVDGWRVTAQNQGPRAALPDGSIDLVLREALPRCADERVRIETERVVPPTVLDEPWERDRLQSGILTWTASVPAGGTAAFEYGVRVEYPTGWKVAPE